MPAAGEIYVALLIESKAVVAAALRTCFSTLSTAAGFELTLSKVAFTKTNKHCVRMSVLWKWRRSYSMYSEFDEFFSNSV